jgi:hypothetical protein
MQSGPCKSKLLIVIFLFVLIIDYHLERYDNGPLYWITLWCEPSIFEKVFIWFLGQPVVWSKPKISQIEAWSSSIYAWYQEFEFDFCLNFF